MGSVLGARLGEGGCRVIVALDGRSERTCRLAAEAALEDVGSLATLVDEADILLSIVPPGEAASVASELVVSAQATSARPLVVDLNAVAPSTAVQLAETLAVAGIELVDGAISGPPPTRSGLTRIYISGPRAAEVARLPFAGIELRVVGDSVGLASAVKMCTGSVYKGNVAIFAQALRTAHSYGVVDAVLDDLVATGTADRDRAGETLARASAKAWRYVAEMEEIATTQAAAGLDPSLFEALRDVYAELALLAPSTDLEAAAGADLKTVLDGLASSDK